MDITQRVLAEIHDYYREHGKYPQRITVSQAVGRELDAEKASREETFGTNLAALNPKLVAEGHAMWIRGILVVADLDDDRVLDLRKHPVP